MRIEVSRIHMIYEIVDCIQASHPLPYLCLCPSTMCFTSVLIFAIMQVYIFGRSVSFLLFSSVTMFAHVENGLTVESVLKSTMK